MKAFLILFILFTVRGAITAIAAAGNITAVFDTVNYRSYCKYSHYGYNNNTLNIHFKILL